MQLNIVASCGTAGVSTRVHICERFRLLTIDADRHEYLGATASRPATLSPVTSRAPQLCANWPQAASTLSAYVGSWDFAIARFADMPLREANAPKDRSDAATCLPIDASLVGINCCNLTGSTASGNGDWTAALQQAPDSAGQRPMTAAAERVAFDVKTVFRAWAARWTDAGCLPVSFDGGHVQRRGGQ